MKQLFERLFAPPISPRITDPARIDALYRHYRTRLLVATFLGYALFYFCRKNISIVMPALSKELGYSNTELGILGSLLYVTYGVGKFVNGIVGDHVNPRVFMALGLLLSALCNAAFGLSSGLLFLALFWALNGWFQSMGFPPCARLLANWYSVSERGLIWSIWNISHQVGAVGILLLASYLTVHYGWRSAFVAPAALCTLAAIYLYDALRDIPTSLGLPPVAVYRSDPELDRDGGPLSDEQESIRTVLYTRVLRSRSVWLVSIMNLFVYIVRTGAFDWAPKYLVEQKGSSLGKAGVVTATFELAGIVGSVLVGVVSDRLYGGRRAPMCFVFMLLTAAAVALLYVVPKGSTAGDAVALALIGFAVYGPQFLVGVFVTDVASPKASATAIGLTGLFGYAGSALSGVGTGYVLDRYGWRGGFVFWGLSAVVGAACVLPLWNAGARRR